MSIYSKVLIVLVAGVAMALTGCDVAVLTYHDDNFRTGWNKHERELTYSTVNESSLTSIVVPLDDQVDAQPLVVPRVKITAGPNRGNKQVVVYVATANNSVYAIDATTGQILLQQNFGPPVEAKFLAAWPNSVAGPCGDNGPNVGITGTPVIDRAKKRMYLITYTLETDGPTYKIHALDLGSLTEPIAAQKITASHQLNDSKPFPFQATYQRQRPGLLLTHGVIYAGFGSFCDWGGDQSRGWVLGWKADSLDPLPSNQLNDRLDDPPTALSSVWMSGYGLAADESGSPYFVTGNSWDLGSYDGINNIQESVVKSSHDLTHFSVFTPSNAQTSLDPSDGDLGSGGVLLIPSRVGSRALAAAAGKDGRMFILDRHNLGGYTPGGPDKVVYTVPTIGACWCGQSYFNDGSPHVVSSGGTSVNLWGFQTSPQITLVGQGSSEDLPSASVGFFTSVSSQGKSNAIVWAVSRPDMRNSSGPPLLWLYAFKAVPGGATSNLPALFHALAGIWSPTAVNGANSSSVPVVANGKVYVGSYKALAIFGLNLPGGKKTHEWALATEPRKELGTEQREVDGTLVSAEGGRLKVRDKTGKIIDVDATVAIREYHSVPIAVGRAVHVVGSYDSAGVLHVASVLRGRM